MPKKYFYRGLAKVPLNGTPPPGVEVFEEYTDKEIHKEWFSRLISRRRSLAPKQSTWEKLFIIMMVIIHLPDLLWGCIGVLIGFASWICGMMAVCGIFYILYLLITG